MAKKMPGISQHPKLRRYTGGRGNPGTGSVRNGTDLRASMYACNLDKRMH